MASALPARDVPLGNGRLFPSGLAPFFTACVPHRPTAATPSLNHHATRVPTAEGEGRSHLVAECGYRGLESREGGRKCHPS